MEARARVRIDSGVVFDTLGERALHCDVYTPREREGALPGVLLLHGGGWRRGDRAVMRGFGLRIARAGFVCVASEYRLVGESPWPAQIQDVNRALRWMVDEAPRLGIDPDRLAIQGNSAGAHLALMAAGACEVERFRRDGDPPAPRLSAVVAIYPPTLLYASTERPSGGVPAVALLGSAATPEAADAASPRSYVKAGFPPTFLIHGSADQVVPPSASQRMYEDLCAAGVAVELKMFASLPHGFANIPDYQRPLAEEILSFLQRALFPERRAALLRARAAAASAERAHAAAS